MNAQAVNRQTGLPTACIEAAAQAACQAHDPKPWHMMNRAFQAHWRRVAIAAISACAVNKRNQNK